MSTKYEASQENLGSRMSLWLLMITIILLFGTLSVVFLLVEKPDASAFNLHIPSVFYLNTLALALSSLLLHRGLEKLKSQEEISLWPALVLGIAFLAGQIWGWIEMNSEGLYFQQSHPKVSFLYVLTGLHGLHLIGGLIFLGVLEFWRKANKPRLLDMAVYFWHFLGVLWVYLLIILLVEST